MNIKTVELGEKLLKAREENLISVEELAEKVNLDSNLIDSYENAKSDNIDINIVEQLAEALNIESTELTGWKGDSLGQIIKYRRKELGMTQKDVADHVNVSHSAVSRWESGEIENITQDKIAGLADILQISPLTLIAPDSDNSLYKIKQEYLDIAKRLQLMNIPIDICEQIVDIFERLQETSNFL